MALNGHFNHVAWFTFVGIEKAPMHVYVYVRIHTQMYCKHVCLLLLLVDHYSCRCFDAVLLCSIAEDHLPRLEPIAATGMSRVVSQLQCLHLHILMALAELSGCLLINSCAQVSSEETTEDRKRHRHIIHSIYFYPQRVRPFALFPL